MASVSYWVSINFFIGGLLFVLGSIDWMVPNVGDTTHGADMIHYGASVAWPYLIGAIFFVVGCYLALVEIINGNLQLDAPMLVAGEASEPQRGSVAKGKRDSYRHVARVHELEKGVTGLHANECGACVTGLVWWAWQPNSEVYLGTLAQFIGSLLFLVACIMGMPDILGPLSNNYHEEWIECVPLHGR